MLKNIPSPMKLSQSHEDKKKKILVKLPNLGDSERILWVAQKEVTCRGKRLM